MARVVPPACHFYPTWKDSHGLVLPLRRLGPDDGWHDHHDAGQRPIGALHSELSPAGKECMELVLLTLRRQNRRHGRADRRLQAAEDRLRQLRDTRDQSPSAALGDAETSVSRAWTDRDRRAWRLRQLHIRHRDDRCRLGLPT